MHSNQFVSGFNGQIRKDHPLITNAVEAIRAIDPNAVDDILFKDDTVGLSVLFIGTAQQISIHSLSGAMTSITVPFNSTQPITLYTASPSREYEQTSVEYHDNGNVTNVHGGELIQELGAEEGHKKRVALSNVLRNTVEQIALSIG